VLNSAWVSLKERDDKANLVMDKVYNIKGMIQALYRQGCDEFDIRKYDEQVQVQLLFLLEGVA
jgi:hypothetical protein